MGGSSGGVGAPSGDVFDEEGVRQADSARMDRLLSPRSLGSAGVSRIASSAMQLAAAGRQMTVH